MTQNNLGTAYADLPTGDRAANLARAIDCYTQALRFCTAEAAPLTTPRPRTTWATPTPSFPPGTGRPTWPGRSTATPRRCGSAPPRPPRSTTPRPRTTWAPPTPSFPPGTGRPTWPGRSTATPRRCGSAPPRPPRLEYATTQNNLGTAYAELPTGDRAANLARAIDCYTEALRFRTAEAAPLEYATTQNNLGIAYAELPTGDRAANLARAIELLHRGAAVPHRRGRPARLRHDPEQPGQRLRRASHRGPGGQPGAGDRLLHPGAAVPHRRGRPARLRHDPEQPGRRLRRDLPTGDRAANLARAIDCYTEALRFYTAEAAPLDYATTQNNLGTAYPELPTGDRAANLARAIDCYTEALRFHTAEAAPLDYATTQNNLGNAYAELPTGDRAANLARAIDCYTEALRFYTAEAAPLDYAMTQNNLGTAYAELPTGDRAANLARAIDCYTEALRFRTAEAAPLDYAATQNNLGIAYASFPPGTGRPTWRGRSTATPEALRFHTAEAAPAECRLTARSLGDVHFEQDRWAEAHTAYSSAIRAGEFLYQATGSEAGRQAELGAAGDAVAADAYCLARLGRLAEAVQRLEAGRARALGEALARDRAALQEASEADRAAFVAAADRIKALEAEGRRGQDTEAPAAPGRRSFAERSAELVRAREDLAGVIQRIRAYLPGFMGEGLDYPEVAAAASPARPLVYLLTTSRGGLALLVPAGSQAPAPEHAVWLDGFTAEQLDELLVQRDPSGEARGGYLVGQVTGDLDQLAAAVTENIEILRRELLGPLAGRLADLGVAAATVVPVGRLSLLPLPAAAPEGCTIALAPSARALRAASHALRERAGEAPVLLAVGNPLPLPAGWNALGYAGVEVRAIERFFAAGSRRILPEEAATGKAVAQGLPGATHLHLACHGGFDPDEPLDSALYLAGGDRLTLRDLLDGNLDLSSQRLAVLSACQTGITEFNGSPMR